MDLLRQFPEGDVFAYRKYDWKPAFAGLDDLFGLTRRAALEELNRWMTYLVVGQNRPNWYLLFGMKSPPAVLSILLERLKPGYYRGFD